MAETYIIGIKERRKARERTGKERRVIRKISREKCPRRLEHSYLLFVHQGSVGY